MMILNQSGQGVLDFLFASVLIFGTAALIGALSTALTLTEAIQYVSFSGARSYFAADRTIAQQSQAAEEQVNALVKNLPFLTGAINSGWIKITRKQARNYTDYAVSKGGELGADSGRNEFTGYQLEVALPLLTFKIPLMGNLVTPSDGDDVKVTVSSFLMREPTYEECVKFNNQLYQVLLQKNSAYARGATTGFVAINDNGC